MLKLNKDKLYYLSLIICFIVSILIFCFPIYPTYIIGDTVDGVTQLVISGYSWFWNSHAFLVLFSIIPMALILLSFIIQMIYLFKLNRFSKVQSIIFSLPFLFICIFCFIFAAYVPGGIFAAIFIYISIVANISINRHADDQINQEK